MAMAMAMASLFVDACDSRPLDQVFTKVIASVGGVAPRPAWLLLIVHRFLKFMSPHKDGTRFYSGIITPKLLHRTLLCIYKHQTKHCIRGAHKNTDGSTLVHSVVERPGSKKRILKQ